LVLGEVRQISALLRGENYAITDALVALGEGWCEKRVQVFGNLLVGLNGLHSSRYSIGGFKSKFYKFSLSDLR
jgi:hypothetical protein